MIRYRIDEARPCQVPNCDYHATEIVIFSSSDASKYYTVVMSLCTAHAQAIVDTKHIDATFTFER